jgi:hypothetical protein
MRLFPAALLVPSIILAPARDAELRVQRKPIAE